MNVTNPFNITKAVDFSDQEILDLWVDWPNEEGRGLADLIKPTSPMPMFIIGGKGSGKTHLIRYHSFSLQKIRYKNDFVSGILKDKYIGIYFRCGGLNPSRFQDKGINDDVWEVIFSYYIDLWFAYNTLSTIKSINIQNNVVEEKFCDSFYKLFDKIDPNLSNNLDSCINFISNLQKKLDYDVNNCIFSGSISTEILVTRGKLVFGIPKLFVELYSDFEEINFLYLIDEYENFSFSQQKFLNTLIREKEGPCTFKVGSRLFGIKTHKTFSDNEENKEGSEFEYLKLDAYYRDSISDYNKFALEIILSRLRASGFILQSECINLNNIFVTKSHSSLAEEETRFVKGVFLERPHFKKFQEAINKHFPNINFETIASNIRCDNYPLLEKSAINVIYKNWCSPEKLEVISERIKNDIDSTIQNNKFSGILRTVEHFKTDYLAQLYRENNQSYRYFGLETIIDISWGNPRHLLMILKRIFTWSLFKNEISQTKLSISPESQNKGIIEASEWFFNDSKQIGPEGDHVQKSIERLCDLFRAIRFSTKPSECSLCTFSVDFSSISEISRKFIIIAKEWSLIVQVGTHTDKNNARKINKYQINKLLSPRWDIAYARRGTLELSVDEVSAIFDEISPDKFKAIRDIRISRMEPPFGSVSCSTNQLKLPVSYV